MREYQHLQLLVPASSSNKQQDFPRFSVSLFPSRIHLSYWGLWEVASPTWYSVARRRGGAPLAGRGRGGRPVVLTGLAQGGHLGVHLVVLVVPRPLQEIALVVLRPTSVVLVAQPLLGHEIEGLPVRPYVLHLPEPRSKYLAFFCIFNH